MHRTRRPWKRVRKADASPNITTDVFSDPFEDAYELGDDVAEFCLGGDIPARNSSDVPSGDGG